MFPVESLSAAYMEEREINNAARIAQLREQAQKIALQTASQKPAQTATKATSQTLQQPRPGFLGGMFSGLVKSASGASTPTMSPFTSRSQTPACTPLPSPSRVPTHAEIEAALVAEKKRDADICAMPAWYH